MDADRCIRCDSLLHFEEVGRCLCKSCATILDAPPAPPAKQERAKPPARPGHFKPCK